MQERTLSHAAMNNALLSPPHVPPPSEMLGNKNDKVGLAEIRGKTPLTGLPCITSACDAKVEVTHKELYKK